MLNPQTRRARKVHLTGSSEDLIRRGAVLLEDALHTASLPESDGRLLIVKSLNVGMIRPDASSATLALAIEERLRGIAPVYAADSTARLREAVYFRDDAEPSIMLALRLAQRQSTSAWFWRLAVPAWKPEMSLDESLRAIFFNVTRTKAGTAAAVRLVRELEAQNALDPLLTAIHPQDGAGLLRAFGWSKPPKISDSPLQIPARWQTVLTRWIPRWGKDDGRVLWLAGVALAADNPLRMLDGDLMMRSAGMVENIINSNARAHSRAPLQATSDEATNVGVGLRPAHSTVKDDTREERATRRVAPTEDGAGEVGAQRTAPLQNDMPASRPNRDIYDAQKSDITTEKSSGDVEMSTVEAHRRALLPDFEIVVVQESSPAPWPDTPMKTQHAGLFFLIPVLARLGIAEFLTPELIEAEFPFHLLRFIGQHLGLPDDDPISAVLATDAPFDPQTTFVTPEAWKNGIANPGEPILRRVGEKNALFDWSERLAVAAWEGEMPQVIRERIPIINSLPILYAFDSPSLNSERGLGGEVEFSPFTNDLLRHTWMTASRRWLRRNAYLGLADVVLRPGHITATRTHIDLFFDLAQADMRVRRVGLDIDPGWVSWLGRVVYFHYREQRL